MTPPPPSPLDGYLWYLIVVMLLAGLLGGGINYTLIDADNPKRRWPTSLLAGVGASFIVPLFLNMVSSDLIQNIRTNKDHAGLTSLLVFAGFCLVAGISSRAFITTITDRLLKQVQEAKQDAAEAKEAVEEAKPGIDALLAKGTEPEVRPEIPPSAGLGDARLEAGSLPVEERAILKAFGDSHFALRSLSGLSRDSNLAMAAVLPHLTAMRERGWVDHRTGKSGDLWFLTDDGQAAMLSLSAPANPA